MKKHKCDGCEGRDRIIKALATHVDRLERALQKTEKNKGKFFLVKKNQNGIDLVL